MVRGHNELQKKGICVIRGQMTTLATRTVRKGIRIIRGQMTKKVFVLFVVNGNAERLELPLFLILILSFQSSIKGGFWDGKRERIH